MRSVEIRRRTVQEVSWLEVKANELVRQDLLLLAELPRSMMVPQAVPQHDVLAIN